MKKIFASLATVLLLFLAACSTDAAVAERNLSTAAEQFEIQRMIVGINTFTDEVIFTVEGKCSIEHEERRLIIICKHGEDDYRRHMVGLSDNVTFVLTQIDGVPVDVFRTRIILKPERAIPDLDLTTSLDR